jgi:hypothetical protein
LSEQQSEIGAAAKPVGARRALIAGEREHTLGVGEAQRQHRALGGDDRLAHRVIPAAVSRDGTQTVEQASALASASRSLACASLRLVAVNPSTPRVFSCEDFTFLTGTVTPWPAPLAP